jgi:hypothetical protein
MQFRNKAKEEIEGADFKLFNNSKERPSLSTVGLRAQLTFSPLLFPCGDRIRQAKGFSTETYEALHTQFKMLILEMWDLKIGNVCIDDALTTVKLKELSNGMYDAWDNNHYLTFLNSFYAKVILIQQGHYCSFESLFQEEAEERPVKMLRVTNEEPSDDLTVDDVDNLEAQFDIMELAELRQSDAMAKEIKIGSKSLKQIIKVGETVGEIIDRLGLSLIFPPQCDERILIGSGVYIELKLPTMPKKFVMFEGQRIFKATVYCGHQETACIYRHIGIFLKRKSSSVEWIHGSSHLTNDAMNLVRDVTTPDTQRAADEAFHKYYSKKNSITAAEPSAVPQINV